MIHEAEEAEIDGFTKYWPHELLHDPTRGFYKALGGGAPTTSTMVGFLVNLANPWSQMNANLKAAKGGPVGDDYNLNGDGFTHGGTVVMKSKGTEIAYQFGENTIGDVSDPKEVVAAASKL